MTAHRLTLLPQLLFKDLVNTDVKELLIYMTNGSTGNLWASMCKYSSKYKGINT